MLLSQYPIDSPSSASKYLITICADAGVVNAVSTLIFVCEKVSQVKLDAGPALAGM
jgi:hypothetical protein